MTKKLVSLLLVVAVALSFGGCGLLRAAGNNPAEAASDKVEITPDCAAREYRMELTLDTERDILSGVSHVTLTNTALEKMDRVYFCLFSKAMSDDVTVESVTDGETGEAYTVEDDSDTDCNFCVKLQEPLPVGASLTLAIRFSEHVSDRGGRFSYVSTDKGKIYSLMMCFPTLATCYGGEWQLHDYFDSGETACNAMTDYSVTFTCPEDYQVLASGRQETEKGVTAVTAPNVREMCIVASNDMEVETVDCDGVTLRFAKLNYDGLSQKTMDTFYGIIKENAVAAMTMYREKIGEYIYDELDIVPFSMGSDIGGMEMPGLITYEALSDYDKYGTTYNEIVTVAHEIAHEWFYCAVGDDQYTEPWLDESFADYLDTYYTDHALELYGDTLSEPTHQLIEHYGEHITQKGSAYINLPCEEYNSYSYIFVYSYGDDFLYQLEQTMGSDAFFAMLQDWYSTNTGKIATGSAFVATVLRHDNSREVKQLMSRYLDDDYLY